MAKGKKKPSFSESVALNDLTWQWETRKACNAGAPVAVWLSPEPLASLPYFH